jgi:hypothetical protein
VAPLRLLRVESGTSPRDHGEMMEIAITIAGVFAGAVAILTALCFAASVAFGLRAARRWYATVRDPAL